MREDALRTVLLVRSLEAQDREGTLIPLADRLDAARRAKREGAADPLVHRARALLEKVVVRHPFVAQVHSHAGGSPGLGWALVALGLLAGVSLSALDGTRRINILSLPLAALVAWNLLAYGLVAAGALRTLQGRGLPAWIAGASVALSKALVRKSKSFNAPLAEGLAQFLLAWQEAARPLLLARAARVLHLAAAAVGLGLVGGLYLRGIAFAYQAGWESTFLEATDVGRILAIAYGPASWLTGIAIPETAVLESLRWRDAGGGESANRWIHLMAGTVLLFVVLPRLVLALVATATIARWSRQAPVPASLTAYYRTAFGAVEGLVAGGDVLLVPCGHAPGPNAVARARTLLAGERGASVVTLHAPIAYGEEEAFVKTLAGAEGDATQVIALLFSLATTPEDENQGLLLAGLRDALARDRPRAQLAVLVDEAPYRLRMLENPARVEERRKSWSDFIAARGLEPRFVDLAA